MILCWHAEKGIRDFPDLNELLGEIRETWEDKLIHDIRTGAGR